MSERDIVYGGFYQNIPGNMCCGNFGFQTMPEGIVPFNNQNITNDNYLMDITNRINNLEQKIKALEKNISNTNSNLYQDDDSMYMI